MLDIELEAFWKSGGLLSIHLRTQKRNYNLHLFPLPKDWILGVNPYWQGQRVLDFGGGPLFRIVCIDSLDLW